MSCCLLIRALGNVLNLKRDPEALTRSIQTAIVAAAAIGRITIASSPILAGEECRFSLDHTSCLHGQYLVCQ